MSELLQDYLTEEDVAKILGVKRSTLKKNRCIGENHPPYIKVGDRVLFKRESVQKWLDKRERHEVRRTA